jgi:hypothetical protein
VSCKRVSEKEVMVVEFMFNEVGDEGRIRGWLEDIGSSNNLGISLDIVFGIRFVQEQKVGSANKGISREVTYIWERKVLIYIKTRNSILREK